MWDEYKSRLGGLFTLENNLMRTSMVLLVTFIFGAGIPIMFIIALAYIVVNEMCLRYQLAYHFRKPFNYSNELNDMFMKFCAILPVFYSAFGFYMYSSRQIYDNAVVPKTRMNGTIEHNHTIKYCFTTVTPGTPFLFLFVFSLADFIIRVGGMKYYKVFKCIKSCNNEKIKQCRIADCDNFYQNLRDDKTF
jgi:hypothetical protein